MKKLRAVILICSFSLFATQSHAQIWGMINGGGILSKSSFTPTVGLGAGYQFGYDLDQLAYLGASYGILSPITWQIPIVDTLGNVDSVESSIVASLVTIDAEWRKYYWDTEADDEFGFYTTVGLSLWMVSTKVNLGVFNDSLFAPGSGVNLNLSNTSIHVPLGVGVDWTVKGWAWCFIEARISLPITTVSNDYIGTDYGIGFHFNAGTRIRLARL